MQSLPINASVGPNAHRFWLIPELLIGLVEVLDGQWQGRMAQVNSQISPRAIAVLWETLPCIDLLLKLLPSNHEVRMRHLRGAFSDFISCRTASSDRVISTDLTYTHRWSNASSSQSTIQPFKFYFKSELTTYLPPSCLTSFTSPSPPNLPTRTPSIRPSLLVFALFSSTSTTPTALALPTSYSLRLRPSLPCCPSPSSILRTRGGGRGRANRCWTSLNDTR